MGTITLPQSMEQDRLNNIKANSVHVDDNFNTLLNAVNRKLEIDGSIVPTADLPMGNHKLTQLATPTASGDAATKGYTDSALLLKADLASPTLTGTPTAPTPTAGDNSTNIATTAFVTDAISTAGASYVKLSGNQTVAGTKTFSAATYGVGSDATNSFLTTAAKSKSSSGYFKLGNGLIVQWLKVPSAQQDTWYSLPTSFSGGGSYIAVASYNTSAESANAIQIQGQTATQVQLHRVGGLSGLAVGIIAIGY